MDSKVESAASRVIGAAIRVHRVLGPGYLESVYHLALEAELEAQRIAFRRQVVFDVQYRGRRVGEGRLDFLVEGCLILEIKAVDELGLVHRAQILSYLKATGHHLGLLINFNVPMLSTGVKRVVL